ncbi:MAG: response regulator [Pseudomonadota bacterium]
MAAVAIRVLVIDDNLNLAENIADILGLEGCFTEIATTVAEALAKALPRKPDVVVIDYRLPGENGASLARRLREMGIAARAVVISALTDDHTLADVEGAGATFLAKPLDITVLIRVICEQENAALGASLGRRPTRVAL